MIPTGFTPGRTRPNPNVFDEFPPQLGGLSILELTDESNACKHGALPFDGRKPAGCRCWNIGFRMAEVVPLPVKKRAKGRRAA